MMRHRSHLIAALGLVAASSVIAGCAAAEPARPELVDQTRPVAIAVDGESTEQAILAHIYYRVIANEGRDVAPIVEVDAAEDSPMTQMINGETDFIIGCTGQMLTDLNPHRAEELSTGITDADTPAEAAEISDGIYAEMMGVLPVFAQTTDPSSSQPCAGESNASEVLPQNLVPIFRTTVFDRSEEAAINSITKLITDHDIADILDKIADGDDVESAVNWWIESNHVLPASTSDDDKAADRGFYL